MVGQDSCGTTLFTKSSKGFNSVGVVVAKAMSISVAVEEAISRGFSHFELFESDSLRFVHFIIGSSIPINELGLIIYEIRRQCPNRSFTLLANKVSHAIAHYALSVDDVET